MSGDHRFIYLHGFATGPGSRKAQYFRRQFELLGRELETPDLACGDFEHLTVTRQLECIARAADGAGKCVLIGSSMGGYLAALYASLHPAEVSRAVLLAPAFGFRERWQESLGRARMAQWRDTGTMAVYHYSDRRERALAYGIIEDAAAYPDAPAVAQPVLIVHGVNDAVVPCGVSVEYAAANPQASLVLTRADHELLSALEMIWDRMRVFLFGS